MQIERSLLYVATVLPLLLFGMSFNATASSDIARQISSGKAFADDSVPTADAGVLYMPIVSNSGGFSGAKQESYAAGVQYVNLENSVAEISVTAYNSDGSIDGTGQYTIPANGSITLFPLADLSTGFSGSIAISSDKSSASIVNILSGDFSTSAAYASRSTGSTSVSLPILNAGNSGFDTWFGIQNTSTDVANVTVEYSDGTSRENISIPSNSVSYFYQSEESHNSTNFAGTISSDQPVVAAVIQESVDVMFAYTGLSSGSTELVFPLVNANNSGYITGLQIQNFGSQRTEVTLSYTPASAGSACTETIEIGPGESGTFGLLAFSSVDPVPGSTCTRGDRFVGSARVTGNSTNQPLVGVGNQLLPGVNGEAYSAFSPEQATDAVVLPLIMDNASGFFTGFNVMNVGNTSTSVTCWFSDTSYTVTGTLAPGEALSDLQFGNISDGYVGSGTCAASATGDKIVAIVNQLGSSTNADQLLVYEGISTTGVSAPPPVSGWRRLSEDTITATSLAIHQDQLFVGDRRSSAQGGGLYLTNLGGCSSATPFAQVNDIQTGAFDVAFLASGTGALASFDEGMYYTSNGGASWTLSDSAVVQAGSVTTLGGLFYAGSQTQGIYQSTNGGVTWDKVDAVQLPQEINVLVANAASNTLWIGTESGVYIYAVGFNQDPSHPAGGLSGESQKIWDIAFDNGGNIYLATKDGIYRGDGQNDWARFGNLPSATPFLSLEIAGDTIYAGAEDLNNSGAIAGVWQRPLGGGDWQELLSSGWDHTSTVRDLTYDSDHCPGLLAATDNGVWLYKIP